MGLPLLAVLVAILALEPYYGIVDDASRACRSASALATPFRGRRRRASEPPAGFRYALADARLCPAAIDGAKWRAVWTPSRDGGFVLYESTAEDDR